MLCDEIIAEYREVLARKKFKFNQEAIGILIAGLIARGIFIDALPAEEMIPDQKDVVFYEIAMEG